MLSQFTGLDVLCPGQVVPARLLTRMVSVACVIPASPVSMAQHTDTKVHETCTYKEENRPELNETSIGGISVPSGDRDGVPVRVLSGFPLVLTAIDPDLFIH